MRHSLFPVAAVVVGCSGFLRPSVALAVINADNPGSAMPDNESQPAGLPEWNEVGSVGGGSGVYLGNGWVLTADHVGAGNFTLDGTTYNWNGQPEIRLNNPGALGPADLVMFQVISGPTGSVNVASSSAPLTTSIYNVGYGLARTTTVESFNYDPTVPTFTLSSTVTLYQGFGFGNSNAKSWGQNTLAGISTYNIGFGYVSGFYTVFESDSDQIIYGDSGGGVFNDAGELIGVDDAIGLAEGQLDGTVLYGDESDIIDIAPFYSQIMSHVDAPEPTSLALLAAGGLGLLSRRRRAVPRLKT